jgi:3-dehydroquinate dehydratase II
MKRTGGMRILVVNGPNLNLLGEREPGVYGRTTLGQIEAEIRALCRGRSARVRFFQSNHEGAIIDCIHANRKWATGMVINPGALTHYSYSLRDAIAAASIPAVEVHLSDIRRREPFRRISVTRPVCVGSVIGKGKAGYLEAVEFLLGPLPSEDASVRPMRNVRRSVSATRLRKSRNAA